MYENASLYICPEIDNTHTPNQKDCGTYQFHKEALKHKADHGRSKTKAEDEFAKLPLTESIWNKIVEKPVDNRDEKLTPVKPPETKSAGNALIQEHLAQKRIELEDATQLEKELTDVCTALKQKNVSIRKLQETIQTYEQNIAHGSSLLTADLATGCLSSDGSDVEMQTVESKREMDYSSKANDEDDVIITEEEVNIWKKTLSKLDRCKSEKS